MIALIDYGVGNLQSFVNLYQRLHIPVTVARSVDCINDADKLILPGVGHFDHAMDLFNESAMRDSVIEKVVKGNTPILGICVGMQMLANSSEEGVREGLGWVPGKVRYLNNRRSHENLPMPHMGWNDVMPTSSSGLFANFQENDCRFYFLHSYFFDADSEDDELAHCQYGGKFTCAVRRGNVFGVQFHPEKSHRFGEMLLQNFSEL